MSIYATAPERKECGSEQRCSVDFPGSSRPQCDRTERGQRSRGELSDTEAAVLLPCVADVIPSSAFYSLSVSLQYKVWWREQCGSYTWKERLTSNARRYPSG